MKKNLIALAVAGAIAAPAAALADATVYGQINMSYGAVDEEVGNVTIDDNIQVRSHASRVGVKGSEDLGNGLTAKYQLEWGVNPDDDANKGWSRRNQWVGLAGGFGEVRVGRHDTPLKLAQGKFDQFNDLDGDIAETFKGEDRVDNVVAYLNNFGPVGIAAAFIPGEGDDEETGTGRGDSFADAWSAAVTYSAGPLFLSAGYTAYDDTAPLVTESVARLVATYSIAQHDFGVMYQMEEGGDLGEDYDGFGVSWKMGLGGGNAIKAQYLMNEEDGGTDEEWTSLSVGFDHAFSKQTTLYAVYTKNETESDLAAAEREFEFFGVGMLMKF